MNKYDDFHFKTEPVYEYIAYEIILVLMLCFVIYGIAVLLLT
jgi:hypothetical protein